MSDEQHRQALSAFSMLVDAANAQHQTTTTSGASNANAAAAMPNKVPSAPKSGGMNLGGSAAAGGMTLEERAAAFRQAALSQLQQQHQHDAASQYEALELQEALQRELLHREALRRQQLASLMGFSGGGAAALAGLGLGGSNSSNNNNNGYASAQEAEYLQQLRLEALVQQRRQETLAQLALAQELGMSPDMQATMEAEQLRQAYMLRQEQALLAQAAAAASSAGSGGGNSLEGILAALQGGGGGISEEGILQILQERERQQKLAFFMQAQQQQQQQQQQQVLPQQVGSSSGVAAAPTHSLERADLIASVFAKSNAAHNTAAAEEQERIRKLQQQLSIAAASTEARSVKVEKQTAQAAAAAGQEGSKTTILPCRARGMPMDHNVKTAYFVIPEDIKHGTELYCSYFACRNAGIKFRYCVYCKLPVAKRNFAKRHRHTGKISTSDLPGDFEEHSEGDELSSSEQGSAEMKSPAPGTAVASAAGMPGASNATQWNAQELFDLLLARNVQELRVDGSAGATGGTSPLTAEMLEQLIQKNQGDWDKLLLVRPQTSNDPSAMASWLLEVLRVSDVEKQGADDPSAEAGTTLATMSKSKATTGKAKKPGLKSKKRKQVQKSPSKPIKETKPKKKKAQMKVKARAPPKVEAKKMASKKVEAPPKVEETISIPALAPPKPSAAAEASNPPKPEKAQEKEDPSSDEEGFVPETKMEGKDDTDVEDDEDNVEEVAPAVDDDDSSTSSEDSVDLRASKKART